MQHTMDDDSPLLRRRVGSNSTTELKKNQNLHSADPHFQNGDNHDDHEEDHRLQEIVHQQQIRAAKTFFFLLLLGSTLMVWHPPHFELVLMIYSLFALVVVIRLVHV